jgi:YVTN family beta-propeller protein
VTNSGDDTLSVIDTESETVQATIAVGSRPLAMVISDDGTTGYVAINDDTTLSVIDLPSHDVIARGEPFAPIALALGSCPLLPTPTPTVTTSPLPTGTPVASTCAGDCNADDMVGINELIVGVNIALGNSAVSACPAFDRDANGQVAINELITAVNAALFGC